MLPSSGSRPLDGVELPVDDFDLPAELRRLGGAAVHEAELLEHRRHLRVDLERPSRHRRHPFAERFERAPLGLQPVAELRDRGVGRG